MVSIASGCLGMTKAGNNETGNNEAKLVFISHTHDAAGKK